ncbi:unnamed protein product [Toxocara canis]|uniref:Secreted protein n=1 Tax=Toxocara canis TaxID=6265 RepID=A0A183U4A4_TOXCA|nr:unnamed protein product [Toxocara canis]
MYLMIQIYIRYTATPLPAFMEWIFGCQERWCGRARVVSSGERAAMKRMLFTAQIDLLGLASTTQRTQQSRAMTSDSNT